MSFMLNALFSLSVGIGAVIGWVRFRRTDPAFLPFIILLSAGTVNEIISICLALNGHSNWVNDNLYSLAEAWLLTWQFYRWRLFGDRQWLCRMVQVFFTLIWLIEIADSSPAHLFNSYYRIIHAFLILLMSISMINQLVFKVSVSLLTDPVFLICMGLSLFFTYSILVETFWLYGLNQSTGFRLRVYSIISYINLLTNLVFALATLWIPLKRRYIMQF